MRKEEEIQRTLRAISESGEFADNLDGGIVQHNHDDGPNHATPSAGPERGPKPPVPARTSISEYRGSELIQLIKWIASVGQLRTDVQIIDEIIPVLGFNRRGVRIESAIRNAIAQWRPKS